MKFKVSYYDFDTDKYVTKVCYRMSFYDGVFEFMTVDDPIKIYKSIIIDHPIFSVSQNNTGFISISVVGYQYTKNGSYEKTTTKVENVRETAQY